MDLSRCKYKIYISFALLCFILGNGGLLSTITFVAMLLYSFVRFNCFGNAFQRSNMELCGEISYGFRKNARTVDCKESNFVSVFVIDTGLIFKK